SGSGRDWEIDPTTMLEVRTGISEANMRGDYTDDLELDEDWHDFIARNIDELEAANAAAAVTAERLYTESGLEDAHRWLPLPLNSSGPAAARGGAASSWMCSPSLV